MVVIFVENEKLLLPAGTPQRRQPSSKVYEKWDYLVNTI